MNAQRRESLLSAQDSLVDIVRALKASEQLDDTYLFFISDNGCLIGEHRIRGGKVAPYEVSVKAAGTAAAGRAATRIDGPAGPGAAAAASEVGNTRAATAANASNQWRMDPRMMSV